MNDRHHGAAQAPEWQDAIEVAPKRQTQAAERSPKPLTPLVMMSEEEAGACVGDACVLPVRKPQGEVQ